MTQDIARVPQELWQKLVDGPRPWRTPVLASATPQGGADARTVVLRHVFPAERELVFYSDARLGKIPQLEHHPKVCLVIFDERENLQVRLYGEAQREMSDAVLTRWWDELPQKQREIYQIDDAATANTAEPGRRNFAAFRIQIERFHCLWITDAGNCAAEFEWLTEWHGQPVRP